MKTKQTIMIGTSALLVLILAGILFYKGSQGESPQPTSPIYSEPRLPQIDWPLPNAEELSLVDVQTRVPYSIPLPEGVEVQKIWGSTVAVEASERSVAIQLANGLLLIIHPMAEPPNWDGIIASVPAFVKVDVNGNTGIGIDPGTTEANGMEYFHPGSVEWWADGLDITLYSDTLSLEELLKVAQTVR